MDTESNLAIFAKSVGGTQQAHIKTSKYMSMRLIHRIFLNRLSLSYHKYSYLKKKIFTDFRTLSQSSTSRMTLHSALTFRNP